MKKYFALFDIDKTIYNGFISFPLIEYQLKSGLVKQECVDELNNDWQLYKKGLLVYEETIANLCTHWADGLKEKSYSQILQNTEEFFKSENNFYKFFPNILNILLKNHDVYLVTGEPQFVAQVIADKFGVNGYISTGFEVIDDIFTGKVKNLLARRNEKHEAIQHLLGKYKIDNSFAFGDSEGDIEMLNVVQNQICINPSLGLKEIALEKGWIIKKQEEVEKFIKTLLKD